MSYASANLIKYQAKILSMFNAGEMRVKEPKVFNSLRKGTELMVPSHREIQNAAKRSTGEVNFFARSSRALGNAGEVFDHTGVKGNSGIVVPSWTPYDDKFKYSAKQANGSVFTFDEEIMNEMVNLNNNFTIGLEAAAVTWVNAFRSGVNVATAEGTFSAVNDVFEITETLTNIMSTGYRVSQIMESAMEENSWTGGKYTCYCDSTGYNKMQALAANGSGNSINSSFQFGNTEYIRSSELNAPAIALGYTKGYFIMVQDMNTAVLDWMPKQNETGLIGPDGRWSSIIHPATGLPLGLHEYSARADDSGDGGENQDLVTQVQAFGYVSFNHSPLSTATETPLLAFSLV